MTHSHNISSVLLVHEWERLAIPARSQRCAGFHTLLRISRLKCLKHFFKKLAPSSFMPTPLTPPKKLSALSLGDGFISRGGCLLDSVAAGLFDRPHVREDRTNSSPQFLFRMCMAREMLRMRSFICSSMAVGEQALGFLPGSRHCSRVC